MPAHTEPGASGPAHYDQLAAHYDHLTVERDVRSLWEANDIYRFDRDASGPVFSIDTPPPYVSASHLHVGHAMSYSQADFVVRYHRMRGERVFYPIGFDDNGLPTERYVEKAFGVRAIDMPRADFVKLCLDETARTAARYEDLWRSVGLSVDWSLRYSTIDERCQRTAQAAFIQLHRAGHIRRGTDPILWCTECRTALAQADVDDLDRSGQLHEIAFIGTASGASLRIATSRPELLAACVALYFHPDDERYQPLLGSTATVPVFGHEVPIRTDASVDPHFGTGLMMVCTFGDSEDVAKWRRDRLELRMVVEPDGTLGELAGPLAGLPVAAARKRMLALLVDAGVLVASRSTRQSVGVHERCQTPVEFQIRPQWFVNVVDRRERLLGRAHELDWVPAFMRRRLEDWIDGLTWDWNISRQRRYGVPFPVWFCEPAGHAVLADLAALPVDPLAAQPPVTACPECGSTELVPDPDVMDTWMTSSLTPQINDGWALHGLAGDPALAPMSLRVQAFEIIRTWLFYTVVQSDLLFDRLPWTAVMISGWGLNEQGRKISKRDLDSSTDADGFNRYVPDQVIAKYGADALRLWATRARVGNDLRYNEKDVRAGRKLAVKLWNVGRFIQLHAPDPVAALDQRSMVDRWVLSHLAETIRDATKAMDEYDYTQAYLVTSRFFWSVLCDRYLEMIKERLGGPDQPPAEDADAARATVREVYRAVLGLLAPFAPYVTEDQYQRLFRADGDPVSLHLTAWPTEQPGWASDPADGDRMVVMLDAVRALRARIGLGGGARVATLVLEAREPASAALLDAVAEPLRAATRAGAVRRGPADVASGVDGIFLDLEL
jgi:valyl-tRNA synthetase